jgi:hypothetical protein
MKMLKPGDFVRVPASNRYLKVLRSTRAPDVYRFVDPNWDSPNDPFLCGEPINVFDVVKVTEEEYEAWKLLTS